MEKTDFAAAWNAIDNIEAVEPESLYLIWKQIENGELVRVGNDRLELSDAAQRMADNATLQPIQVLKKSVSTIDDWHTVDQKRNITLFFALCKIGLGIIVKDIINSDRDILERGSNYLYLCSAALSSDKAESKILFHFFNSESNNPSLVSTLEGHLNAEDMNIMCSDELRKASYLARYWERAKEANVSFADFMTRHL